MESCMIDLKKGICFNESVLNLLLHTEDTMVKS